jgi:hypothetical protein
MSNNALVLLRNRFRLAAVGDESSLQCQAGKDDDDEDDDEEDDDSNSDEDDTEYKDSEDSSSTVSSK